MSGNDLDDEGWTELMLASFRGDVQSVHLLICSQADVDHTDAAAWTALMYACQNGHESCVQALLNANANVDHMSRDGPNALMLTCQNGHVHCTNHIIAARCDINDASADDGRTALMQASKLGHISCVNMCMYMWVVPVGALLSQRVTAPEREDFQPLRVLHYNVNEEQETSIFSIHFQSIRNEHCCHTGDTNPATICNRQAALTDNIAHPLTMQCNRRSLTTCAIASLNH